MLPSELYLVNWCIDSTIRVMSILFHVNSQPRRCAPVTGHVPHDIRTMTSVNIYHPPISKPRDKVIRIMSN